MASGGADCPRLVEVLGGVLDEWPPAVLAALDTSNWYLGSLMSVDDGDVLRPGERSRCDSPAGPNQNCRPMLLGGEC